MRPGAVLATIPLRVAPEVSAAATSPETTPVVPFDNTPSTVSSEMATMTASGMQEALDEHLRRLDGFEQTIVSGTTLR